MDAFTIFAHGGASRLILAALVTQLGLTTVSWAAHAAEDIGLAAMWSNLNIYGIENVCYHKCFDESTCVCSNTP